MHRRRRPAFRVAIASLVAFSLISSTPGISSASGPPAVKGPAPGHELRKEPSVRTADVQAQKGFPDHDSELTVTSIPSPVWPQSGQAEVELQQSPGVAAVARAGALPVSIGPAQQAAGAKSVQSSPAKIAVDLSGRVGNEVQVRLRRADGIQGTGKVSLRLDYSGFKQAFGGDWSTRLQLAQVPACAAQTPDKVACRAVALPTHNDGKGQVAADVPIGTDFSTFALQAAPSGPAGDSTTTSLSPTATWQVGGSSGDFTWSYPMQVPPSLLGPKPDVSLAYSSGSVDGRTTAGNSQSSWVGAGFELAPGGSIERRYASCGAKSEQSGNNGTTPVGDYCWATDNATFTLNGAGGELVRDDTTGIWKSRSDDGITVQHLAGATNGDLGPQSGTGAAGEYWLMTDKAGTKFYFGKNKLPGATSDAQDTHSVWTVPVFGNNAAEPCHQAAFANSWCQQAYNWNLDYVVDSYGNTMSLFYDTETNNYARAGNAATVSTYTRSGNIRRIEYGQQDGEVFDDASRVAAVDFTTADRCLKASGCVASDYPDTPLDLECTSASNCNNHFYPSFWTKKRLAKVTTEVWRGTQYAPVSSWSLQQSYLDPQDEGRSPMLWLDGITNVGLVGGQVTLPQTTFSSEMKPNRLLGPDSVGQPVLNWPRMKTITYGTGGQIVVGYLGAECSLPDNVPAPDNNDKRCQPIKWTPQGQAEREDWFNKYVVHQVTERDLVGGTSGTVTTLDYLSKPAWHYDEEDGLVEIGRKTWSQWRGYEKVKVTTGDGVDGPQQVQVNTYLRGMDADRNADGSVKEVTVADSAGGTTEDLAALAGQLREQSTYDGDKLVDRTITDHWVSDARATRVKPWGTTTANEVEEKALSQDEAVGDGWRKSASQNTFDEATGRLVSKTDQRDLANPSDDVCTRYEYFASPDHGITELPSRQQTVDVTCDKPWTKDNVLSDQKSTFDPATGAKLTVQRVAGFDAAGQPTYQTVSTSTYDAVGRVKSTTDAKDETTSVAYTPSTGGPLTRTTTTLPNGQTSSTEVEPAWGEETAVVDPAGRRSTTKRDPLGRVTETWLAGNSSSTPNEKTEYSDGQDKSGLVTVTSLRPDGKTEIKREFSDGLMRRRQTQEESADGFGRVVTDYIYDSQGREVKQNGPYYNDAPLGFEIVKPVDEKQLPAQQLTGYDTLGRAQSESFLSLGKQLWSRQHANATGVETIEPVAGEQATTRITNIQGQLVELRSYHGNTATGAYDKTLYTYHPAGQLATVTDAAGNVWRYEYDVRGRKVKEQTPDDGVTAYTYNDLDQVESSTDARSVTQTYTYDSLGRKTTVKADGQLLSEWKYDTIKPGQVTSATRYVNGNPYTTQYTGYDDAGRPTGEDVVIPPSEGSLAGTYSTSRTYTTDGRSKTIKEPAMGGLPEETLTYGYDGRGRPTSLGSAIDSYVTEAEYTPYGETSRIHMERGSNWAEQLYDYDSGTHQVATSRLVSPNGLESNVQYTYDAAGNITKMSDSPTTAAADTQCFGYDYARRLTQAWTPADGNCQAAPTKDTLGGPAPYWNSWTFDVTGNRKTETRTTVAGQTVSAYDYPEAGQPRPHAVQTVTTTGAEGSTTDTYAYDEAGNLKTRTRAGQQQTLTWMSDGKLATLSGAGAATSNVYDADGNLLIRKDATGTTLALGDNELLLKPDGSLLGTRYYTFGDQTVAVRTGSTALSWLSSDNHGTSNVSVDANTLTVQRRRLTPYGETRGTAPTAWPGQRGFVGGLTDDSTGLVHLGARDYDPALGKFISVDPVVDAEDPQQLNAYAYGNNSPVTFSDPDGQRYVTETVTTLRTVVKTVYKRIIEQKQILEKKRVFVRALMTVRNVFTAFGWGSLARVVGYWITVEIKRMIKIVRTIKQLVKVQERVTRKLKRWVGDTEAKQLDAMMKRSTDILANATRQAQAAASTWAAVLRNANAQGKKGVDAYGGGSLLLMDGSQEPPSDEVPMSPLYIATGTLVATVAGWGARLGCTSTGVGGFVSSICDGAAKALTGLLFYGAWNIFTISPREQADMDAQAQRQMHKDQWCHTIPTGCTTR